MCFDVSIIVRLEELEWITMELILSNKFEEIYNRIDDVNLNIISTGWFNIITNDKEQ